MKSCCRAEQTAHGGFGKRGFLFVRGREVVPDMGVVTRAAFVKVTAEAEVRSTLRTFVDVHRPEIGHDNFPNRIVNNCVLNQNPLRVRTHETIKVAI